MKKEQFKKMLKPIIKECIQEALVESNLISGIISEVVKGMGAQPQQTKITEQKKSRSGGPGSALAGVAPDDAGVDISGILNIGGDKWSKLI